MRKIVFKCPITAKSSTLVADNDERVPTIVVIPDDENAEYPPVGWGVVSIAARIVNPDHADKLRLREQAYAGVEVELHTQFEGTTPDPADVDRVRRQLIENVDDEIEIPPETVLCTWNLGPFAPEGMAMIVKALEAAPVGQVLVPPPFLQMVTPSTAAGAAVPPPTAPTPTPATGASIAPVINPIPPASTPAVSSIPAPKA